MGWEGDEWEGDTSLKYHKTYSSIIHDEADYKNQTKEKSKKRIYNYMTTT